MNNTYLYHLEAALQQLTADTADKPDPVIDSPLGAMVTLGGGGRVVNMRSGNYLGLADSQRIADAAHAAMMQFGYGNSGPQPLHRQLESALAQWLGTDDALIFASAAEAGLNVFEALFSAEDAVIADEFIHPFVAQGIRLSQAQSFRFSHNNLYGLEAQLQAAVAAGARFKLIVTEGVFPLGGDLAALPGIVELAKRYGALLMVDDTHGAGVLGGRGEGTAGHFAVSDQVDIYLGSLGEALGGVCGGYLAASRQVVAMLRHLAPGYRLGTALPPASCAGVLMALQMVTSDEGAALRRRALQHACRLRRELEGAGFRVLPGLHALIPVLIGDAHLAGEAARQLLHQGVLVGCFGWPFVPHGRARLRLQVSAAHDEAHIEQTLRVFVEVGKRLALIV